MASGSDPCLSSSCTRSSLKGRASNKGSRRMTLLVGAFNQVGPSPWTANLCLKLYSKEEKSRSCILSNITSPDGVCADEGGWMVLLGNFFLHRLKVCKSLINFRRFQCLSIIWKWVEFSSWRPQSVLSEWWFPSSSFPERKTRHCMN